MEQLIFILELFGIVAFSISGAIVAFEEEMDVFGVAILGMITSIGGGLLRDLILGIIPPTCFVKPIYALLAIVTALICFIKPVRRKIKNNSMILIATDSIGLGIFTVVGASTAISLYPDNLFLILFVTVLTGCGGSILRDIFANRKPAIFVKYFYATASLLGAISFVVCYKLFGATVATIVCASFTCILRLFAAKYRWKLPK